MHISALTTSLLAILLLIVMVSLWYFVLYRYIFRHRRQDQRRESEHTSEGEGSADGGGGLQLQSRRLSVIPEETLSPQRLLAARRVEEVGGGGVGVEEGGGEGFYDPQLPAPSAAMVNDAVAEAGEALASREEVAEVREIQVLRLPRLGFSAAAEDRKGGKSKGKRGRGGRLDVVW